MAIAYHLSFRAYGFWLPNDPRGSWSKAVWANGLRPFGPPTHLDSRHVDPTKDDRRRRQDAKRRLLRPAVRFSARQVASIGLGLGRCAADIELAVFAAAIMPDHVHLVVAVHKLDAAAIIGHFKRAASRQLKSDGCHPFSQEADRDGRLPTPWAEYGWKVFLDTTDDVLRSIQYVEQNPVEAGLPAQQWPFVSSFLE